MLGSINRLCGFARYWLVDEVRTSLTLHTKPTTTSTNRQQAEYDKLNSQVRMERDVDGRMRMVKGFGQVRTHPSCMPVA
jgi:hypothetical protein